MLRGTHSTISYPKNALHQHRRRQTTDTLSHVSDCVIAYRIGDLFYFFFLSLSASLCLCLSTISLAHKKVTNTHTNTYRFSHTYWFPIDRIQFFLTSLGILQSFVMDMVRGPRGRWWMRRRWRWPIIIVHRDHSMVAGNWIWNVWHWHGVPHGFCPTAARLCRPYWQRCQCERWRSTGSANFQYRFWFLIVHVTNQNASRRIYRWHQYRLVHFQIGHCRCTRAKCSPAPTNKSTLNWLVFEFSTLQQVYCPITIAEKLLCKPNVFTHLTLVSILQ